MTRLLTSWLGQLQARFTSRPTSRQRGRNARRNPTPTRLHLEQLEERALLSTITEIEPNSTVAQAQAVAVALGDVLTTAPNDWLTINGSITSGDQDYFRITLANRVGLFLDIDAQEIGLSTLDSIVTVFDQAGTTQLGANDDGYDFETGAPFNHPSPASVLDSSLYLDLNPGTYLVRVTPFGTTLGNYTLRLLADSNYSSSVPIWNSNPGATDTLFLDFNGHSATDTWGTYSISPYDLNGNGSEFTPAERLAIRNAWRIVAEDYSPFAINVTTGYAGTFGDGVAFRQVIGNSDGSEVGRTGVLGVALRDSYSRLGAQDNVAFTFARNFDFLATPAHGISGKIMALPVEIGNASSHEFGHALGLRHYVGTGQSGAVMFTSASVVSRKIWFSGTSESGSFQDDMAVISNMMNTFDYRPDDHGGAQDTASVLSASGGGYQAGGIIERLSDRDYFRFTGTGVTTIRVNVDEYVNNLDAELRLYDASGTLIGFHDPAASFDASLSMTLPAGTYYVEVRSDNEAGEAGQYQLLIATTVNTPPTISNLADQVVNEDTPTGAIAFTVGDAETAAGSLTVTATSSNPTLVPNSSLLLGGSSASRTLTITPAPHQFGTSTITVTVSDGSLMASDTFVLTVNPVNDAPSFTGGPNVTVLEDSIPVLVVAWASNISAGAPNESGQALTFVVTGNTNPALLASPPSIVGSTLGLMPAPNAFGSTTVTIVLRDDGGTAFGGQDTSLPYTFTITVTPVNDAPVLDSSGTMSLTAINRDEINSGGTLVSAIIASAGGDRITDVDAGAQEGMAITSADSGNGAWQFSLNNGVSWIALGSPSESNARLLASDAGTRVRFVPNAGFTGTANFTFRAWDRTSGSNGDTANATVHGGTTAFSSATESAGIQVLASLSFTRLSSFATGAANSHYTAPGDFDRDGRLDMASISVSDNRLFIAYGDGTGRLLDPRAFANPGSASGQQALAVGDLNNDSYPDVVLAGFYDDTLTFFYNRADGSRSFLPPTTVAIGSAVRPRGLAIGHLDADNLPDLAINYFDGRFHGGDFAVWLNPGGTSWRETSRQQVGGGGSISVVLDRFDGDANLDAVVTTLNGSVGYLRGNGNGTFQPAVLVGAGVPQSLNLDAGNWNGDGHRDLVVTDRLTAPRLLMGNGSGGFSQGATLADSPPHQAAGVARSGDIDGDGDHDLVTTSSSSGASGPLFVYLNNGTGTMTLHASLPAPAGVALDSDIELGDLNGDGRLDVVAPSSSNGGLIVYLNGVPAPPTDLIVDRGQAGYAETGAWFDWSPGHGGSSRYANPGTGNSASWTVTALAPGSFLVQATWVADTVPDAPYRIYDGSTLRQTVLVDQTREPVGPIFNGRPFQTLGAVQVSGGTLRVELSSTTTGWVIADAVRIEPLTLPTVDLHWAVSGINGPTSGSTATSFTVSRNYVVTGAAAPAAFTIGYYSSTDAILGNGDDVLLASETISSAADRATGPHSGSSPALQIAAPGTYRLFARVDNGGSIAEANEENNVALAPQTISITSPLTVDLHWTGGELFGPTRAFPLEPFALGRTYTISGSAPTSSFTIGYYTSVDAVFGNGDDVRIGSEFISRASDMTVGTHSGVSTVLQVAMPGTYRFFARVDDDNVIAEINEGNNVIPSAQTMTILPPVDLHWTGGGISAPASVVRGTPFTIHRTYAVSGAAVPESFLISYIASVDAIFGNGDDVLLRTETISAPADLAIGVHAGTSPALQIATAGTYRLFAVVDGASTIQETNEFNNVAQTPLTITITVPPASALVIDRGDPGYQEIGAWSDWSPGHAGSSRYANPGTGDTVRWTATGLTPGTYVVQATWVADTVPDAPYRLYDGTTLLQTVIVDQTREPTGEVVGGRPFQTLAVVTVTSGTLRVELSSTLTGWVIADAVRIVPVG